MIETMKKVVGYKGKITFDVTKPNGVPRKLIDVAKLGSMGWRRSVSLKEVIKKTYE
jgi:GDP-L-fucose synthase